MKNDKQKSLTKERSQLMVMRKERIVILRKALAERRILDHSAFGLKDDKKHLKVGAW